MGITPNENISVPLGNILLTEAFFEHFGLYGMIEGLKSKGVDLGKLTEAMVAYKLGDNFSTLRCHRFAMQGPVRGHLGLPECDVKTFYRALEALGENREAIIAHFRRAFIETYGVEAANYIFDWTTLVYYGSKPEDAKHGRSKDGRPEERQVSIGVAQLSKPYRVPIGMTVMPGNAHDGNHMKATYGEVKGDMAEGSTAVFDAGANQKDVTDAIVGDGFHFVTRRKHSSSVAGVYATFPGEGWECLDGERGEHCKKVVYPSRVNYYYHSRELHELEMLGVERRARKKYEEAKSLQRDIEGGKRLKKRYEIGNPLIKATISLQTRLCEFSEEEAMAFLIEEELSGYEGFYCLTSDTDMGAAEARALYRERDVVEKLFSSMKTDIGIRPIRAWTKEGVRGVLLVAFLAQAAVSVTRFITGPASATATKFVADAMQKLTLTVEFGRDGRERRILSNFDPLCVAIMRSFGVISEA